MLNSNEVRIVFWGTSDFAIPALSALLENSFQIVAVITNQDEPTGRSQELTSPPTKVWAEKHGIQVLQPKTLKELVLNQGKSDFPQAVRLPEADIYIVAAYGKIIPKEILTIPSLGVLNIHPSLLPRWRGPSPVQYTILSGDQETGVTIIKMDELMDHGLIVGVSKFELPFPSRPTYRELHDQLSQLGAELLIKILSKYIRDEITPVPQDEFKTTFSKMLKRDSGRIDWKKSAVEIDRLIRAFSPWPGAWTIWPLGDKLLRIKVEKGLEFKDAPPEGSPGYTWQRSGDELMVKAGAGSLFVENLTIEAKKSLAASEVLKGYPEIVGTTFI